ncbi:hypothetical protein BKA69DRAFT_505855 [Paraphysoderma sedebokerense]|nr:hypothetical protein BKA69DRAFT_505855 [Paraphysoderma sedebokerense]
MFPVQWTLNDGRIKPVNALIFPLTLIASIINTILLYRIYKSRRILKVFHMSLVNMVISDTLFSYVSIVLSGLHLTHSSIDYFWCYYSSTASTAFLGLSISSATVISIERYFQIVLGKTITFRRMLSVLISLWISHILVGFFPLITNMDIVVQASQWYCLPDLRRTDLLYRLYGILVVGFILLVLSVITVSYYQIWKKAVADGFKWNEKSFVIKNVEKFRNAPLHAQPIISADTNSKIKNSDLSLKTPISSIGVGSKSNSTPAQLTFTSENAPVQDETARAKQMAMTKKLAVITLAIYLAWLGSLFSFLFQMSTGFFVNYTWDAFWGIFHFCHCIFNPLIILTMDSRWKIRLTFLRRTVL